MSEYADFLLALQRCEKTDNRRKVQETIPIGSECFLNCEGKERCDAHIIYRDPSNYGSSITLHFKNGELAYAEGWGE